jgi:hypothetical protein
MRRSLAGRVMTALLLVTGVVVASVPPVAAGGRDVDAFRGLGAWIDVFDYVPAFKQRPGPSPVATSTIDDLAALGVRTIYLQAAIDDPRATSLVVDRGRVGALLRRAHDDGVAVVAWYYPQLVDLARDRRRLDALADFRAHGERFDGIALDIESRQVADVADRNHRLEQLTHHVRRHVGSRPVGAIVYPAVLTEVVNPGLWPGFPYRKLAKDVDVWLPMTYWTFRDGVYRDAFTYTDESVRRLRRDLHDRSAAVHPIGGLGASSFAEDYDAFVRAGRHDHALGWSIYDADTTSTTAWRLLRGGPS